MKDLCIFTFAVGMITGAYIVSKSSKMQNTIKDGEKAIKKTIKKMSK